MFLFLTVPPLPTNNKNRQQKLPKKNLFYMVIVVFAKKQTNFHFGLKLNICLYACVYMLGTPQWIILAFCIFISKFFLFFYELLSSGRIILLGNFFFRRLLDSQSNFVIKTKNVIFFCYFI